MDYEDFPGYEHFGVCSTNTPAPTKVPTMGNAALSLGTPANSSVTLVWPPESASVGTGRGSIQYAQTPGTQQGSVFTPVRVLPPMKRTQSFTAPPLVFGSPTTDCCPPPQPQQVRSQGGWQGQSSHTTSTPRARADPQWTALHDNNNFQVPASSSPYLHAPAKSILQSQQPAAAPPTLGSTRPEDLRVPQTTAASDVASRRASGLVVSEHSHAGSSCAFASVDTLFAATAATPRKQAQGLLDQMQDSPLRTHHLPSFDPMGTSNAHGMSDAGAALRSTVLKRHTPMVKHQHSHHRSKRPSKHRTPPSRVSKPKNAQSKTRMAKTGSLDRWMVPDTRARWRSRPTKGSRASRTTATHDKGLTLLQPLQRSQHVPQVQQPKPLHPVSVPIPVPIPGLGPAPAHVNADSQNSPSVPTYADQRYHTPDTQLTRYCPKTRPYPSAEPKESKEPKEAKMASSDAELEFDAGPDDHVDQEEWDEQAYPSPESTSWSSTSRTLCRWAPRSNLRQAPSSPPSSPHRSEYYATSMCGVWDAGKDKEGRDRDAAFALLGLGLGVRA